MSSLLVGVAAAVAVAAAPQPSSVAFAHIAIGALVALVLLYLLLVDGSVMIPRPSAYRVSSEPIFCIGLSRTGTTSIACALDAVGLSAYHSCFKMVTLANGKPLLNRRWAAAYDAHSDFCPALVFRELASEFPAARFVLTTRRGGGAAWGASMVRFTQTNRKNHFLLRYHPTARAFFDAMYGHGWHALSASEWAALYDRHLESVRAFFTEGDAAASPHRLLEMDITSGDGWDVLLPFLQIDAAEAVRGRPFPHRDVFVVSFVHQVWWQLKNAALYVWPRRTAFRLGVLACALAALALLPATPLVDFGQCGRSCRIAFGGVAGGGVVVGAPYPGANASVSGTRNVLRPETCTCTSSSGVVLSAEQPRRYDPSDWRWPFETQQVCGADGAEYASAAAAHGAGTSVANCGVCGRCSNAHDAGIYHAHAKRHTLWLTRCAIVRLVFGERAAAWCLTERIGHSAPCARCFNDNMACTIAHCYRCVRMLFFLLFLFLLFLTRFLLPPFPRLFSRNKGVRAEDGDNAHAQREQRRRCNGATLQRHVFRPQQLLLLR